MRKVRDIGALETFANISSYWQAVSISAHCLGFFLCTRLFQVSNRIHDRKIKVLFSFIFIYNFFVEDILSSPQIKD